MREAGKRLRALFLNGLVHERVAVSGFVARTVRAVHRVAAGRVCVVENGVDASRFERADGCRVREELRLGDAPLVACVSRLDDEKGVEWLVRAIPRIGRGAHLALVGEGPRLPAWRALSESLGVAPRVHFLGLRQDVEEVLAASRLLAVNQSAGSGDVLLNAIAAAVIGGTSLFGGRGTVWAALLGILVIQSISNGMDLLSLDSSVKFMITGAVLLVAVTIDAIARRGREVAGA